MVSHKRIDAQMDSAHERITNASELKSVARLENDFTNRGNNHWTKAVFFSAVTAVSGGFGVIGLTLQPAGPHSNTGQVVGIAIALISAGFTAENLDKKDKYKSFAVELRDRISDYHDRRYNGQR